ncbi:hypothetical protein HHI36_018674 [Cryptolaemus montrouzieri]|uniref:Uncharacterized protein n=1 Tax=Cryptolaemus montrouzieri TaxID=559131 RepID=A0ABD2P1I2_9CUCU
MGPLLAYKYQLPSWLSTMIPFEVSNDQVFQAISIGGNAYIYDPTIIKSMDKNPNCRIDQIYRRVDEPVCKNSLYPVKSMAWKELHKPNTWLFIANGPSNAFDERDVYGRNLQIQAAVSSLELFICEKNQKKKWTLSREAQRASRT